ncbi:hypothetical protein ACWDY7_21485 [Streptomyces calvus]|uniref:Uncharacterized protein n=1 Tax=Streptomyces calvus TaxID=67282 RepID=A0AA40VIJ8_9ACTN|nr:hypothetical protein [Streptomyces calvus]MBA8946890.1 hypothetical protein [Streptomyces calvus]GGP72614.1 hypothetical protein GCM10010247_52460 [Streptomyces calvus]
MPLRAAETAPRTNPSANRANGTRNSFRLGPAWGDGRERDADIAATARRPDGTGTRARYVHSGPLEHDGSPSNSAHPGTRWAIDSVHRELPGVRVQARPGDVLAPDHPAARCHAARRHQDACGCRSPWRSRAIRRRGS